MIPGSCPDFAQLMDLGDAFAQLKFQESSGRAAWQVENSDESDAPSKKTYLYYMSYYIIYICICCVHIIHIYMYLYNIIPQVTMLRGKQKNSYRWDVKCYKPLSRFDAHPSIMRADLLNFMVGSS